MPQSRRERRERTHDWQQIQQYTLWPEQKLYERLRPVVLFGETAAERARETEESSRTLHYQADQFDQHGMASLFHKERSLSADKGRNLPPDMRQLIVDLKAEYSGFRPHEIATICFLRFGRKPSDHTVKRVLADGPKPSVTMRRYPPYAQIADGYERRRAIVDLHAEGWSIRPLSMNGTKTSSYSKFVVTSSNSIRRESSFSFIRKMKQGGTHYSVQCGFFIAPYTGLKLTHLYQMHHQQLVLVVKSTSLLACCPVCQTSSRQVHSYYTRTVADLCWADRQVQLELHVRRFVCSNTACSRRTFAEQFGEQIKAYARRTKRCASQLQTIGLMLGGNADARLAKVLGIPVSSDTLLRLVRATEVPERSTPEVLGVDDFALRKGVKYGTILLNLERHCLVDLLPDREKATVAAWLKSHPGVKMVSRDRGGAYAEAAREAAPHAIQIADRFHLSQNVGETVVRIMRRNYARVKEIFEKVPQGIEPIDQSLPLQRHETDKQVSQQRRMAIYEHVISLYEQGCSQAEIAAQLHMSRKRVRECMKRPPSPPVSKQRSTKLAPYKGYLQQRFAADGRGNSLLLYREVRARGYDGCCSVITSYVTQLRQQAGMTAGTGVHQRTQPKASLRNNFRVSYQSGETRRWGGAT